MSFTKYLMPILILTLISCKNETDPLLLQNAHYFEAISSNDAMLTQPRQGEWLYEHHEKGQAFDAYRNAHPPKCTDSSNIIYIKPIGNFSRLQKDILERTRQYVEIFFQQKTILLNPESDKPIPEWARRDRAEGFEQLYAPYILDTMLKGKIPENGIALLAVSEKDLFPSGDWNFVFGLASYGNRVGVSSIYRLEDERPDSPNFISCLSRLVKIATHEVGHMFSLQHCIHAKCVMNGTNHLEETDAMPARACSDCQKKLLWNFRYDNKKRLQELSTFFKANNLTEELKLCEQDLDKT